MTFFRKIDTKAATVLLASDPVWGSAITVQGHKKINVGIVIGSMVSDIVSAAGDGTAVSAPLSTCSAVITLQRQMREEMESDFWHDVEEWSVLAASGEAASSENISDNADPETVNYRIGIKAGNYESGVAIARIGTS